MGEKIRIDKYIWSVRIYKSRTIASEACRDGKIKIGGMVAKPSSLVSVGDIIDVFKDGFRLQFKVLSLLEKRVSAELARGAYENLTSEEELNKYKSWFVGKAAPERRDRGTGRPTKKERRDIDVFKDFFDDGDD